MWPIQYINLIGLLIMSRFHNASPVGTNVLKCDEHLCDHIQLIYGGVNGIQTWASVV